MEELKQEQGATGSWEDAFWCYGDAEGENHETRVTTTLPYHTYPEAQTWGEIHCKSTFSVAKTRECGRTVWADSTYNNQLTESMVSDE